MIIKRKELIHLGCPSAYYVYLDDGYLLYVRYRWGRLVISKSRRWTVNRWDAVAGEEIYNKKIGDFLDSYMDFADIEKIILKEL